MKLHLRHPLIIIAIPLALFGSLVLLMTIYAQNNPKLAAAITADLLLTVPLVYYLLIRPTKVPPTTVVPVMILGLVLGTIFLPQSQQNYLDLFKLWAMPIIELGVLGYVIFKVRNTVAHFKDSQGPDFYAATLSAAREIMPGRIATLFATEIAVFYYGFVKWRARPLAANQFSYHRKSGTQAMMAVSLLIIFGEMFAIHLLIARWSEIAAWTLTGLSAYSAFQVWGFMKSLAYRPIEIHDDKLILKYGILGGAEISHKEIERVELSRKALPEDPTHRKLSPLGELESHNLILHFKDKQAIAGVYGMKRSAQKLAIFVDDPEKFHDELQSKIDG